MPYHYSDPEDAQHPTALPDVEIFDSTAILADVTQTEWYTGPGFYYAFGFPGCLWDSEPIGPYATAEEALQDAREDKDPYTSELDTEGSQSC